MEAARLQCKNLGIPSYEVVPVPHPIVPLTLEEVRARADAAMGAIVSRLVVQQVQAAAL